VREVAPAQPPRKIAQGFGMGARARAIGTLHRLHAAEDLALPSRGRFKTRAALERKVFFRRVDDVDELSAEARARKAALIVFDLTQRREEIAEPDERRIL
jgi:hypothetical protein